MLFSPVIRKMLYRALHLFLAVMLAAGAVTAQTASDRHPVSKSEVFAALEVSKESDELISRTNADLIAAINERGVDFVLTPEEEWQLEMRDASEELLDAIRSAIDPVEREHRINIERQERLYTAFATNYNSNDLASRSTALTAAREFVDLYADDPNMAEIVMFMKRNLPRLEQGVRMMEQREAAMERARAQAVERQQRQEEQRLESERRREQAAANAANNQNRTGAPSSNQRPPPAKDDPPRQPSDPPRQKWPADRRP